MNKAVMVALWISAFVVCLLTGHVVPFVLGAIFVGVVWLANRRGKR